MHDCKDTRDITRSICIFIYLRSNIPNCSPETNRRYKFDYNRKSNVILIYHRERLKQNTEINIGITDLYIGNDIGIFTNVCTEVRPVCKYCRGNAVVTLSQVRHSPYDFQK